MWRRIRRRLLGLSATVVDFERRGFHAASAAARQHLETAAGTFVAGYNAALEEKDAASLGARLRSAVQPLWQGFAFEGAAMALTLLDRLALGGRRAAAFLHGPGEPHTYMVHVGIGWALARLHARPGRHLAAFDPLLRWLVVDGYAFHQAFFNPRRYIENAEVPPFLTGYQRRAFDQGLGRCMWFVHGADAEAIGPAVGRFEPDRRPDLWSGLGLASAYAGGAEPPAIAMLRETAGACLAQLAQGAAFAAKARLRAGNPAPHTELACRQYCAMAADQAADLTDQALADLPADGPQPAFEVWRRRIQAHWAPQNAPPPPCP